MPIYEYQCRGCERDFEELVRRAEDSATVRCPACGSGQVARRLSVFAARDAAPSSGGGPSPMCGRCGMEPGSCGMAG